MNGERIAATVDLHAHSTASDGIVPPDAVPVAAAAAGVAAVALTDHDSVAGLEPALAAAQRAGIRLVPGVELSAIDEGTEVHVLGLHVTPGPALEQPLAEFRSQRVARAEAIVARLNGLGVAVTLADVEREAAGGAIGRPHVARAMVAAGACADLRDAFDRYLGAGRPGFVPKPRLTVAEACGLIHRAGGIAVWAHPGGDGRRERIEALVAAGLDGVEVLHPGHSEEDARRLAALCEHLSLLPSGGSDWHGGSSGRRTLGAMRVPAEWLERQDERVAAMRAAGAS